MNKSKTFAIMDAEFSEVLCDDDEWMLYTEYEKALQAATVYKGKVVTIEIAECIIGLRHQIAELEDIVANGIHLEEP